MRRTCRQPSILSESLHRQLNSYALVASAAGVGVLALSQPAAAKIVYTSAHVVLHAHSNSHYLLDLNHDGTKDFKLIHNYGNSGRYFATSVRIEDYKNHANQIVTSSFAEAIALPAGAEIGSSRQFRSFAPVARASGIPPSANIFSRQWANSGLGLRNRYLGLRFIINGATHYGWARISVSAWPFAATLTGYAYETIPNKAIKAGQTKGPDIIMVQPGTLGDLAAGAVRMSVQ